MSANQVLFKLYKMDLQVIFREKHDLAPFSPVSLPKDLKGDCEFCRITDNSRVDTFWGHKHPYCSNRLHINQYARDKWMILNCHQCPLYYEFNEFDDDYLEYDDYYDDEEIDFSLINPIRKP